MQADTFLGDLTRDSNGKKEFSQAILNKMKEVAEGHNQNALAITKLCGKTNMKYIKEIGPEWCDRPSVQSARRYDALQRPVNHMSLATVWRTIVFEEDDDDHLVQTIDDDCILNFDNTAILLRSPKTTARRLYCAVGSIAALKKLRLSPARTTKGREEKFTQRCVHVTIATTPTGSIACVVIKIKDRRFNRFGKVLMQKLSPCALLPYRMYLQAIPVIAPVVPTTSSSSSSSSGGVPNLSRRGSVPNSSSSSAPPEPAIYDGGMVAEDVEEDEEPLSDVEDEDPDDIIADLEANTASTMEQASADLIVDAVVHAAIKTLETKIKHKLSEAKRAAAAANDPFSTASQRAEGLFQMSEILASDEEISAEMKKLRVLITCDGETFQLRAIDTAISGTDVGRVKVLEFMKFAAACSFIFQPCDVQPGFRTLKRKSAMAEEDEPGLYAEPEYMDDNFVKCILGAMDAASRRTYREFLSRFPSFACVSFPPASVRAGWHDTGLIPFDPVKIFQRWPGFAGLTTAQGEGLIAAVRPLSIAAEKGFLTPQEILAVMGPHLPVTKYTIPTDQVLVDLELGRWLTTWINAAGTVDRRTENRQRKAEAREAAAQRRRDRQQQQRDQELQRQAVAARKGEIEEERQQRTAAGKTCSPMRKKRGKCAGCVAETRELTLHDFTRCSSNKCTALFCAACV
ncbi:hypothetical protein B484DRAFT_400207 [Ochromonadaceae sp. CCMP2298]|nr:hypothetical protein B484DRAFT_400207 [Ochromonadaceae sp. CCMP2298]